MKPTRENDDRDTSAIEAEAMAWLVERDEGFAPGRAAAFEAWRQGDARHAKSVAELEQVLAQLDGLAVRREQVNAHFHRVSPALPTIAAAPASLPSVRWWRPLAWGGVAAALAVGGFFGFREVRLGTGLETRYATTAAGYERARLADGSTLELNTSSTARVSFSAAERRVKLESGEAHFEVAHDPARPFVVHAGGVAVRAVGTAFNVRFGESAVEVTVTEGKVSVTASPEVGPTPSEQDTTYTEPAKTLPTLVAANQRLAVPLLATAPAPAVERLAPADVRATLAWQRRVTDFSDTTLAEVAARFNRHNALQLVIVDPSLGERRIGGMFALDDVEAFVRLLERDGIVRAERDGDTVRVRTP
jgi:transmembrane sensor